MFSYLYCVRQFSYISVIVNSEEQYSVSKLTKWAEIFFEGALSLLNFEKVYIPGLTQICCSLLPLSKSKIGIVGFEQVSNSMRL